MKPPLTPAMLAAMESLAVNIIRLRARYAGHKTALFLRRAGLLSTVVREAVAGTLDERRFYQLYRTGRLLPWYLNGIGDRVGNSGRRDRLDRVQGIIERLGRPHVARLIGQRFSKSEFPSQPEA